MTFGLSVVGIVQFLFYNGAIPLFPPKFMEILALLAHISSQSLMWAIEVNGNSCDTKATY